MMGCCCWTATFDAMMIMDAQRGMIKFKTKLSINWYNNRNRASLRFFTAAAAVHLIPALSLHSLTRALTRLQQIFHSNPFIPPQKKMHFLL